MTLSTRSRSWQLNWILLWSMPLRRIITDFARNNAAVTDGHFTHLQPLYLSSFVFWVVPYRPLSDALLVLKLFYKFMFKVRSVKSPVSEWRTRKTRRATYLGFTLEDERIDRLVGFGFVVSRLPRYIRYMRVIVGKTRRQKGKVYIL